MPSLSICHHTKEPHISLMGCQFSVHYSSPYWLQSICFITFSFLKEKAWDFFSLTLDQETGSSCQNNVWYMYTHHFDESLQRKEEYAQTLSYLCASFLFCWILISLEKKNSSVTVLVIIRSTRQLHNTKFLLVKLKNRETQLCTCKEYGSN